MPDRSQRVIKEILPLGRILYAVSLIVFGIQHFVYSGNVAGLTLLPQWLPIHILWAYLVGAILTASGLALLANRYVRVASIALAAVFFLSVLVFGIPLAISAPLDVGKRTLLFEALSLCGAALLLAGGPPAREGRYFLAISMAVFGIDHVIVDGFIASLIPAWIPWHMFWVYFTAVGMVVAGVAIATRKLLRPACLALSLMFLLWVAVVHAPRVATHLDNGNEWNSAFVAVAMSGAALIVIERAS